MFLCFITSSLFFFYFWLFIYTTLSVNYCSLTKSTLSPTIRLSSFTQIVAEPTGKQIRQAAEGRARQATNCCSPNHRLVSRRFASNAETQRSWPMWFAVCSSLGDRPLATAQPTVTRTVAIANRTQFIRTQSIRKLSTRILTKPQRPAADSAKSERRRLTSLPPADHQTRGSSKWQLICELPKFVG